MEPTNSDIFRQLKMSQKERYLGAMKKMKKAQAEQKKKENSPKKFLEKVDELLTPAPVPNISHTKKGLKPGIELPSEISSLIERS